MNRSPAFQFYPDKWQSHTRRLSHEAYRVYHELLCWMWQSSPDHCSIKADEQAVACAVAMPIECVRIALADIQNAFAPLLKLEDGRLVSNGLRKEAEKQLNRRDKARIGADERWKRANALKTDANASFKQSIPSPTPIPSPATATQKKAHGELQRVKLTDDEYQKLLAKNGQRRLDLAIEILDGYIASKNKRYANHYAVLKEGSWVWDRVNASPDSRPTADSWREVPCKEQVVV